jgi:hypothetical protein
MYQNGRCSVALISLKLMRLHAINQQIDCHSTVKRQTRNYFIESTNYDSINNVKLLSKQDKGLVNRLSAFVNLLIHCYDMDSPIEDMAFKLLAVGIPSRVN